MPRVRRAALLIPALVAACALPQPPAAASEEAAAAWGRDVVVQAMAIPAAWMTRDGDGGVRDVDAEDTVGYGLRAAVGREDTSVGLLWQGFDSDGDVFDAQLLGFDLDVRALLDEGGDAFYVRAGGNIGIAWIDDPLEGGTQAETTAQLRLGFDFEPSRRWLFGASLGGLVIGHPGDLVAYGTFVSFEVALIF